MGKWTLEHHDEVLRNKIKSLVQGAIKRMNVEKESPAISYETFVEELDEGDSFTTSLIDVLVKEMAERRTRPNPVDRRLISERTAKVLRMQAAPLHIYRSGYSGLRDRASRRSFPVVPPRSYSAFHDLLSESDDDGEYGTLLNPSGTLEGARINTDLYDAYFPSTHDLPGTFSRRSEQETASPPPPPPPADPAEPSGTSWILNSPRARSPPATRSAWHTSTSGSTSSLARQPSIRRAYRSRTTDFNEFTSRRRSAIRSSTTQEDGPRLDALEDTGSRSSVFGAQRTGESSAAPTSSIQPWWSNIRRRSAPVTSSSTLGGNPGSTPSAEPGDLASGSTTRSPSSSQLWYSLTLPTAPAEPPAVAISGLPSGSVDSDGERPQVVAPRLRRGGLRPPESLLTHHYEPATHGAASSRQDGEPLTSSSEAMPASAPPSEHTEIAQLSSAVRPQ